MIENFDENLGRLMARLKEWELEENTLLIFLTDNGTAAGVARGRQAPSNPGAWAGFNAGMRGAKGSEYEGGHRVPLFIRWPAKRMGSGCDVSRLTAHFDLLPTLVELCELNFTPKNPLDGISLVPLLRGPAEDWPDRTLFVHVQRQEIPPKWRRSAVMTERWRLVNGAELYDLPNDPGQQHDVAGQHPNLVGQLRQAYERWWATLEPRFHDYGWIVIGSDRENPARITCHDWHSEEGKVGYQTHIIEAPHANGYWMVQVERAGRYEFILRQRPAAARHPIEAAQARLQIGDVDAMKTIPAGATAISFVVNLEPARTRMQTWFTDEGGRSRGAFFVNVRRVQ